MAKRSSYLDAVEEHLMRAQKYVERREWEDAARELKRAYAILSERRPLDDPSKRLRGRARKYWEQVLVGLSQTLLRCDRVDEAREYAEVACRVFPRSGLAHIGHAEVLLNLNQPQEAIREAEIAVRLNPRDSRITLWAARVAMDIGDERRAKRYCMESAILDPLWVEPYLLLVDILEKEGKLNKALEMVNLALELNLEDPRLLLRAARLQHAIGDVHESLRLLERMVTISNDPEARQALAEIYMEIGAYDKVIEHCTRALHINPTDLVTMDLLAFAYIQEGNLDEAIQILSRMVHMVPNDPFARFKLATLYHQKGIFSKAMREYQRVLDLQPHGVLAQHAKTAIEHLDEHQLEQVFLLSAEDPVFRAKLARDPVRAVQERGFQLTEASLELLKNTDFTSTPRRSPGAPIV